MIEDHTKEIHYHNNNGNYADSPRPLPGIPVTSPRPAQWPGICHPPRTGYKQLPSYLERIETKLPTFKEMCLHLIQFRIPNRIVSVAHVSAGNLRKSRWRFVSFRCPCSFLLGQLGGCAGDSGCVFHTGACCSPAGKLLKTKQNKTKENKTNCWSWKLVPTSLLSLPHLTSGGVAF